MRGREKGGGGGDQNYIRKRLRGDSETALMNEDIEGEKEDLTTSFVQILQSFIS